MPWLGLDIGTQSLKAVILGESFEILGSGDSPYQPSHPRPGWAEENPRDWLDGLKSAIGTALERAGLGSADIRSIAICGQLDGCVPVDSDGNALGPAIIWMDRRAAEEIKGVDGRLIAERCGLVLDTTHMAAKIAWLAHHHREAGRIRAFHQPVSFLVNALTGANVISRSLASTTMLYGIETRRWEPALLAAFNIDETALPALAEETDIAGALSARGAELTGLRAGTPVAVGTGDDFSNPLGCGVCDPGIVAISLGTAETVAAIATRPIRDPELLVETHAYPGGLFHLGNPGWLSGGAVRWAASLLSIASDEEFSRLAATAPPGCDGLIFIPALTGAMSPKWISAARGSFTGLSAAHGKAHLARAVLEGNAFAMRDVAERLSTLGVETGRLRLVGGGARSRAWSQIHSDVVQRPADILLDGDASAVGAALLSAVAVGDVSDVRTAIDQMDLDLDEILPDASLMAIYDTAYRCYRDSFSALEPLWSGDRMET